MAQLSVSALDLSQVRPAPPLKHPAFASIEELQILRRRPYHRHRSIPTEWRTAGYVSYSENGEPVITQDQSFLRRGSLTKSGRRARMSGGRAGLPTFPPQLSNSNSSESDSSLDPRRTGTWSASCTFLSTAGIPTPQIRRASRHLHCQVPGMETPTRKRLQKSPSVDSGNSSGGGGSFPARLKSKSPSRKRHGSIGSASTTSSSSLGSLKERLEKTEPLMLEPVRKRSSLSSLVSRKGSDKKASGTLSNDEGIELKSGPSSPTPRVSQQTSSKVSAFRESLKAAKNVLRRSSSNSKLNSTDNLRSFVGSNPKISTLEDAEEGFSKDAVNMVSSYGATGGAVGGVVPPPKPLRSNPALFGSRLEEERISNSSEILTVPEVVTHSKKFKNSEVTEKASTLPQGKHDKKHKDESAKSPTKKVFGKLFGKKNKAANNVTTVESPAAPESKKKSSKSGKSKSSTPDIVEFETEPRKLVPTAKPRVVLTVGKDYKEINEMEVSEEAVALAKKLRELQKQAEEEKTREEETKSLREIVVVGRHERVKSPPPQFEDPNDDGGYHENDMTVKGQSVSSLENGNKTGKKKGGRANGTRVVEYGSPLDDVRRGRVGELIADHQAFKSSSPSMHSSPLAGRSSDEDYDRRDTSSCSRHEFESGIGNESPTSSLDDHLGASGIIHHGHHNEGQMQYDQYDEGDGDEEETSLATTITTTASEMDASFMLSRSLAMTEEDFSYTESFKQLKPFNFDHVDPIPQGKRERLYKVLVVGELGTGKTSIIKRYVHQFFSQHYRATIGVDFALKVLRWDPETVVRLQLWDIAGQERFGSMTRVYYKEAVGAFVVFDVTRAATLEAVPKWKADLDAKVVLPDGRPIPTVLLANKSDQPKEGIAANRDKMNEFCQQQGFSAWFQTSAKDNINIDESANFLVSKILEMDKWSQEPMSNDPEKLDLSANGKHRGGGDSSCAC